MKNLPKIVITGASGFIGSYLIDHIKDDFIIFAIARRARKEANIPYHPNLHWLQCDISNSTSLNQASAYVNENGGADFVIHLAAYYDFTYKANPAYMFVNVHGTKNMLEFSREVNVKRFIFASSIAACNFPENGKKISEESLPDADYDYAVSKKLGERLVEEYSKSFPCTILRFAAVYSDWCEFAPLYKFLSGWLSKKIESRIIAGSGESAIPYIHIRDVCNLIEIILKKSSQLSHYEVFNVSPDGSTSHKEIFGISTRYYFGKEINPLYLPKILAYPALSIRKILQMLNLTISEPFERFWMIKYIDKKLDVNAFYTQSTLEWNPTARYHLTRRLLFLIEKLKTHPGEWKLKNEAALKRTSRRSNLIIYEKMIEQKDVILTKIVEKIIDENTKGVFNKYKVMGSAEFQCYISALYHLLMASIRSSDRGLLIKYIDDIAVKRFAEGFDAEILSKTLNVFSEVIVNHLSCYKELNKIKQEIYDNVALSLQLARDEIEDLYDSLVKKIPVELNKEYSKLPDCKELQKLIHQLSAFYQVSPEDFNLSSVELQNELR
jgi:nucleoside-diphosphate-sugar epimerase